MGKFTELLERHSSKLFCTVCLLTLFLSQISNAAISKTKFQSDTHIQRIRNLFSQKSTIRVLIGQKEKEMTIRGRDIERRIPVKNEIRFFPGRRSLEFNCRGVSKISNNRYGNGPILFASLKSPQGFFYFKDDYYQGDIKILAKKNEDSCDVVNELPIETYLQTLLSKEMNSKWPIEALKAQAVAARTYAIHKMSSKQVSREIGQEAFYDLESSEKHQVSGGLMDITLPTKKASQFTRGEILISPFNTVVPIFFHAKCGGRTLLPSEVWDNVVDGYHAVICGNCNNRGEKKWQNALSMSRFKEFVGWAFKENANEKMIRELVQKEKITIVPDKIENKNIRVYLGEKMLMLSKTLFRRYFGRVLVASNNFFISEAKGEIRLAGSGLGHGVGMCQLGALDMAARGADYKTILQHYFPGFRLERVY